MTQTISEQKPMRQQMVDTLEELFAADSRLALVLADISRSQFNSVFQKFPHRTFNLGILEQTMISVSAGLALEGFIPIVHSIAPFLVERPFEQIKDDFIYQQLEGNFISNGASYDYSTEGMTHHGTGDVAILHSLPGMQIVVPGTAAEFDRLFRQAYANGSPTYYRLSVNTNPTTSDVDFSKLTVIRKGSAKSATLIAVGPTLGHALAATQDLDVTVLYCTTVAPFDGETLREVASGSDIILVEPYYQGVLVPDIMEAMRSRPVRVQAIGVPHQLLLHYGTPEEHDAAIGLTAEGIRKHIKEFLKIK